MSGDENSIDQAMQPEILACSPNLSVREAAGRMCRRGLGAIVVMEAGAILGAWTEQDALALDFEAFPFTESVISDVMTPPPLTLHRGIGVLEAVSAMRRQGAHHYLVVGDDGSLVGVVTRTDIVLSEAPRQLRGERVEQAARGIPLRFSAEMPLGEAVDSMRHFRVDAALVTWPDGDSGIITGRDVLRFVASGARDATVGQVATRPLRTVAADVRLLAASQLMRQHRIRHLAVVYPDKGVFGMVDSSDILGVMERNYISSLEERLRKKRQAIQHSQERFRCLVESSSDWVWEIDDTGAYTYASAKVSDLLGYAAGEVVGKTPVDFLQDEPAASALASILARKQPFSGIEKRCRCKDGRSVVLESSGQPFFDETGGFRGFRGVDRDITERKYSDQLLAAQRRLLERVARGDPLSAILEQLCLDIERLSSEGAVCSVLMLDRTNPEQLKLAAGPSLSEAVRRASERVSVGDRQASCGTAAFRGEMVVVEDIEESALWEVYRAFARRHNIRACWSVPFRSQKGSVLGTFSISHPVPRKPNQWDHQLLDAGCSIASIAVDRQRMDDELRLAAIMFDMHEPILITDAEGSILRVNDAFTAITGYSQADVAGKNPRIFKSGLHDTTFYRNLWRALTHAGRWQGEIWNVWKDGLAHPVWETITAVRNDRGEIGHFVAVFTDMTERKRAEERIERLEYYDPVTNLPNRRLIYERLRQELGACSRQKRYGAVLFLDLDYFKNINDVLGHQMGDLLLRKVAERLQGCLRTEDTVARLGGDEFVVLISGANDGIDGMADDALRIAHKVQTVIEAPFQLEQHQFPITASIGVTLFPKEGDTPSEILKQADTAMYRAKSQGRNHTVFYQSGMHEAAAARLLMEKDLRDALSAGDLMLHYQPQIDRRGKVIGVEVLLRWFHPDQGEIPPACFIAVAEESNLIVGIGEWVLREACFRLKDWQSSDLGDIRISVNVSPRQFRQPDFVDKVLEIVGSSGIDQRFLELELTETLLLENVVETVEKMRALKATGIHFTIDDFGTGYSSLGYLKQLPLDSLKIDRSFVKDLHTDPSDAAIVETIISMAHHLGLRVIAEGVEDRAQLGFLHQHGCDAYQGFYYAQPMDKVAMERFLRAAIQFPVDTPWSAVVHNA